MDSDSVWPGVLDALRLPSSCWVLDVGAREDDALSRALSHRDPAATVLTLDIGLAAQGGRPPDSLLREQLDAGTFHLIALRHVIDDIVESAIAEHEGVALDRAADDARSDIMRSLRAYSRSGDLEEIALPRLIEVMDACAGALHPNGNLLLTHEVLDSDLRLGHPLELYADYIPLAREWLAELGLPLEEIPLDGVEPHWWLCLRRVDTD
ncbi:MAG: hypothetical protein MUQ26_00290 [Armatimonadetes bacterium]|nr:hypothetical protein [Armatimonadota bacterium]